MTDAADKRSAHPNARADEGGWRSIAFVVAAMALVCAMGLYLLSAPPIRLADVERAILLRLEQSRPSFQPQRQVSPRAPPPTDGHRPRSDR